MFCFISVTHVIFKLHSACSKLVVHNLQCSNATAIASPASVVCILSLMMLYRVLKLVRFTVKKEAGKVVETLGRVLRSFENIGQEPQSPKKGVKNFQNFEFWKCRDFSKLLSDPVVIGIFIAYFWRKKYIRTQHEVYSEEADAEVTPRDQEHVMISCFTRTLLAVI